ncbi:MAG: hypothetical protein JXQ99_13430 [Hyphomicrobiaceae bacterium]
MPPPTMPAARCDNVEAKPPPERAGGGAAAAAGFDPPGGGVPDDFAVEPPALADAPDLVSVDLLSAGFPPVGLVAAAGDADEDGLSDDDGAVLAGPLLPVVEGGVTDAIFEAVVESRDDVEGDEAAGLADADAAVVPAVGTEPLLVDVAVDVGLDDAEAACALSLSPDSFHPGAPLSVEDGAGLPLEPDAALRTSVAFKSSSGLGFLSADGDALPVLASGLPPALLLGLSFLSAMLINPRTSNSLNVALMRSTISCHSDRVLQ